jgi:hypothetical protein
MTIALMNESKELSLFEKGGECAKATRNLVSVTLSWVSKTISPFFRGS